MRNNANRNGLKTFVGTHRTKNVDAVHARHLHIGKQAVDGVLLENPPLRLSAIGGKDFQLQRASDQPLKQAGHVRIVVNDKNLLFYPSVLQEGTQE